MMLDIQNEFYEKIHDILKASSDIQKYRNMPFGQIHEILLKTLKDLKNNEEWIINNLDNIIDFLSKSEFDYLLKLLNTTYDNSKNKIGNPFESKTSKFSKKGSRGVYFLRRSSQLDYYEKMGFEKIDLENKILEDPNFKKTLYELVKKYKSEKKIKSIFMIEIVERYFKCILGNKDFLFLTDLWEEIE